jgi:hypothetical protein
MISGFRATKSDTSSPISGTISGPILVVPISEYANFDHDIGYNIGYYNIGDPNIRVW